jgi:hypothetical protein
MDTTLTYAASAPRIGRDVVLLGGRLAFGRRLDLPREFRLEGDRYLGWAGIHLGYCYVNVCWR